MSEESNKLPTDPISAVGIISSLSKIPDGYYVVAKTTDGSDADLWKDGLFKSKVNRYLCFSRKTEPEVVVDMKLIDIKDPLPESFTPVQETLDKKEAAMRKRRLCVKMSPREAAETAVCDIQITTKSKYQLVNYTCVGELNNMGIWYRMGDVPRRQSSRQTVSAPKADTPCSTTRIPISRPQYGEQNSGIYTITGKYPEGGYELMACGRRLLFDLKTSALDDVPFMVSEKFHERPQEMQQVNLMGITIKSLAEIEEEFYYNFGTELSIVP